ncbi:LysR family transcriptional regulator [Clostridium botulinum]|uniref:LysR family transcriptional regulator n=1 Tax=Clostridium botulinum TaxID=1491 RepID=UPI00077489E8|nr:LysR family transcriptional regulator [Clostridium botulinum]MBN1064751.1 LysR family transcriptional regulator [Clostridium botulinum]MBN1074199.1 LysR family transcriptional regulator [Clostridium botulinum]MBN1077578.1 LysR family transcriptional regulator [Clostridium botulinum]MBY6838942.1 LysR family transcriptional regulator [Clostridium botulinum]MBY6915911.1 LysR family transcriptional regulator [Clostridium botulinum]
MISKLDLYKVFRQVGKSRSFSKAAEELYMTQPAISQAIMQLERELDTRLFNRTSKGVSLTNEGNHLFEYVDSAIGLIEAGEEKILEFHNLSVGELKIGACDTISKYYLMPYLEKFHNMYPNIKFKIINSTTLELCTLIKSGEIDIAICNFPIDDPSLELRPCVEVQDIFVCGEKYKYLLNDNISLDHVANLPLIFLEQTSNSRKYVENFMVSKGIRISPEFELGSYDLLLEFAKINLGIACVVKEFAKEYLNKGLIYEVKTREKIPKRNIGVCYLKRVPLSLASTKFVEIIEE